MLLLGSFEYYWSQADSEHNDSENNQTWETRPQIFWRESEEDYPPSQEYLVEIGFKVLDLERKPQETQQELVENRDLWDPS
jgi:hypothetical protein